jgi:hypothetical protein
LRVKSFGKALVELLSEEKIQRVGKKIIASDFVVRIRDDVYKCGQKYFY